MKSKILYIILAAVVFTGLTACDKDDPGKTSIFDAMDLADRNAFDEWIAGNYTDPYNIEVIYRWNTSESEIGYQLVPADIHKSMQLMKLIKHLWLEAYGEVVGIEFLRTNAPRQFMLSGTNAYKTNNTTLLGTAEGGQKVTFYNINNLSLNRDYLNRYYLQTMHHEFGHILHQKKMFVPDFENVSRGDYVYDSWNNFNLSTALQNGFITQYARKEVNEDFVELIALFVTSTESEWNKRLSDAGAAGARKINEKFEIVADYLESEWNVDIFELRDVVLRRTDEIELLDLDNF